MSENRKEDGSLHRRKSGGGNEEEKRDRSEKNCKEKWRKNMEKR